MYRKILVPSDGTVLSEKAIMAAIQFAASHPGCKIVGLSVAEPLSFNQIEALTKSTESDYLLREQLSAQSRVKRIAEMAEEAGVPVRPSSHNRQNRTKKSSVSPTSTIAIASLWHLTAEKV